MPAVLWAALILLGSGDVFSSSHSADWIGEIILRVVGHPLPPHQFDLIHFLIRKTGHLTVYFILGALLFRALRGDAVGWRVHWALVAVALAAGVASADESHQYLVPSRTGSPWDIALDAIGASIAQWASRMRARPYR